MKYLLSNNIFKYANEINNGEFAYSYFQKQTENSLALKILNE